MWSYSVFCRISVLALVFFSVSAYSQTDLKISVEREGFYRLNRDELIEKGFDSLEKQSKIQLFTDGIEQAIKVNANGSIDFFGKQTTSRWTTKKNYILKHGETLGKRIQTSKSKFDESVENTQINSELKIEEKNFRAVYVANGDHDNFYAASLYYSNPYSQTIDLQQFTGSAQPVLEVSVQGYTNNLHNISVILNDAEIGVLSFNYQPKFVKQFPIPTDLLKNGENVLQLVSGISSGTVLLEYVKLSYPKNSIAADNFLKFDVPANQPLKIEGFETESLTVLDITNSENIRELKPQIKNTNGENYSFTIRTANQNRTIWSQKERFLKVTDIENVRANNLRSPKNEADFIILSHERFLQPLERLREQREREALKTQIIDVEDVYNEFNFGEKNPLAIKTFIKFAIDNWQVSPKYLLLVGDSSSDPKNYLQNSQEDLMPSIMADTVYFPMEASSDDSITDFNGDRIADIPTGRLSVKTIDEAEILIEKIINYGENSVNIHISSALLVSDSPINYDFSAMSDDVQLSLPKKMTKLKINRNDAAVEVVRQNILNSINQGYNVVNFLGHGNTANWTSASLLRSTDGVTFTNSTKTSIFVMLACLNGSFAESDLSLSESLQNAPNGGAAAVWASSALTYAYGQVEMSKSFYRKINSQPEIRIGDAIKYAKETMQDYDIRKFSILFGDPTMRIHF